MVTKIYPQQTWYTKQWNSISRISIRKLPPKWTRLYKLIFKNIPNINFNIFETIQWLVFKDNPLINVSFYTSFYCETTTSPVVWGNICRSKSLKSVVNIYSLFVGNLNLWFHWFPWKWVMLQNIQNY